MTNISAKSSPIIMKLSESLTVGIPREIRQKIKKKYFVNLQYLSQI